MKFQGKTATVIIINPENNILLIKRITPPFIGYWALPGGRSEKNETAEQTAIRETKEETGLEIKIISKIGEYHEQGTQGGYKYDYHPTCFLAKPIRGVLARQKNEIAEIRFFDFEEIPELLAFEHTQMIRDYLSMHDCA